MTHPSVNHVLNGLNALRWAVQGEPTKRYGPNGLVSLPLIAMELERYVDELIVIEEARGGAETAQQDRQGPRGPDVSAPTGIDELRSNSVIPMRKQ